MWAWFMITLICSMMTVSMWRTHLKDSYVNTMWSADHDDVYVAVLMVLNFIYTLEFVLRVAAMTAPIGYVRTRRAFTRQLSWLSCDFVAITSTFVEPLCDRTSKTAMLLRLVSSMRAARVMRAIMRWSDGQLMVSTLWSSSRALALVFSFLLLGAWFFGAVLFYAERLAEADSAARSDFDAMSMSVWFMLVTFSTVGYGVRARCPRCPPRCSPVLHADRAVPRRCAARGAKVHAQEGV
jgi:hypothetical protein